jgi:hypothetical protein
LQNKKKHLLFEKNKDKKPAFIPPHTSGSDILQNTYTHVIVNVSTSSRAA